MNWSTYILQLLVAYRQLTRGRFADARPIHASRVKARRLVLTNVMFRTVRAYSALHAWFAAHLNVRSDVMYALVHFTHVKTLH